MKNNEIIKIIYNILIDTIKKDRIISNVALKYDVNLDRLNVQLDEKYIILSLINNDEPIYIGIDLSNIKLSDSVFLSKSIKLYLYSMILLYKYKNNKSKQFLIELIDLYKNDFNINELSYLDLSVINSYCTIERIYDDDIIQEIKNIDIDNIKSYDLFSFIEDKRYKTEKILMNFLYN